jgi:poly(3-hydroxybutyrate) depolymerase
MKRAALLLCAFAAAAGVAQGPPTVAPAAMPAKGLFAFSGWAGPPIQIFYQLPTEVKPDTPVLIAIHGVQRDADVYRDAWARRAVERGFIVAAPEFSRASFPDNESFSSGDVTADDGSIRPRERWTFAAIDPLFDEIRRRTGTRVPRYVLYGHSGGAQFVQRLVMFMPEARYSRAIAANAGWYTMPGFETGLPYGLKDSPVTPDQLKAALGRPLWILLGSRDTDPRSPNLRVTREAMRQGPFRRARGESFYAAAQAAASAAGVELKWQKRYVEGVGHDNEGMAAAAVALVR